MWHQTVLVSSMLCVVTAFDRHFPPNFMFGAATSDYQIEGAWNVSGKTESIWDRYTHANPHLILDRSNGDVAADSYNKWQEDVAACAEMGLHFYRFSIAWTRILPTGFSNHINEAGVKYYNDLINALLENNVEPMVALYHWGLPQKLQDLGGWTNPLIVEWFASFAEVVFSLFGDRVKLWVTINEPASVCDFGYAGILAPAVNEPIMGPYLCSRHVLLAHAKAWRIYDEKFKPRYHGRVSVANHIVWYEAASENMTYLTELARESLAGRYSHPIYSEDGGWPPMLEEFLANLSKSQGFKHSRLPPFTVEEKNLLKVGTYDFYALNHYTSRLVRKARPGDNLGFWYASGSQDLNIVLEADPKWEMGSSELFPINPPGLRKQLKWLKDTYGDLDIMVTENGYSSAGLQLNDPKRIAFMHDYLKQILLSIQKDHVNVIGYTYWSLIDNFEWNDGYRTKFGLYEIDFNDPHFQRMPRRSAIYYASIIKMNTLLEPHHSSHTKMDMFRHKKSSREPNGGPSLQNGGLIYVTGLVVFVSLIY